MSTLAHITTYYVTYC